MMRELDGKNLGPYENLEKIGEGGMGAVYRGYHANTDRHVAIKVLPTLAVSDPMFIKRFEREARIIAQLEHARILPVYDFGTDGDVTYLAMRYLTGGTVLERIESEGRFSPEEASKIIVQVCKGLDYAHRQDIIHRDMSANNIMFDSAGDAYITDFGLAKLVQGGTQLTGSGLVISTPGYVSPEQALGEPVDLRTDIYSLGIVLYHMLIGELPFIAEAPMAIIVKHINDPLPDPRDKRPELSEAVTSVITRATAKNPDDRFTSADEMAKALAGAVSGSPATKASAPAQQAPTVSDSSPHFTDDIISTPQVTSPEIPAPIKEADKPSLIPLAVGAGIIATVALLVVAFMVITRGNRLGDETGALADSVETTGVIAESTEAAEDTPSATLGQPPPTPADAQQPSPDAWQPSPDANSDGNYGRPWSLLITEIDDSLVICREGSQLIFGNDFGSGQIIDPEMLQLYHFNEQAMIIDPLADGESIPLGLIPPAKNPTLTFKARWAIAPGSMTFVIYEGHTEASLAEFVISSNHTINVEVANISVTEPAPVPTLSDGEWHVIVFDVTDTAIQVTVDENIIHNIELDTPLVVM